MNILINGQPLQLDVGSSVHQALAAFGARPPVAVAVNGRFLPRGQHQSTRLEEGDSLEVLGPMEGG
ncbi:sulfur carrier protein ThiS [Gallaecimonas sp. GXIMD4217]|uniref:sulfur carrier protein ThiS n=1 Tax=Gallaecimonas sp. GXIMD4217 TaxID=3131927 RepID=UPI00311B210C